MGNKGRFGKYGGQYVPETLMNALIELEDAYQHTAHDPAFERELGAYQSEYAGRPTPLTFCANMSRDLGFRIYLKREDLVHGGSHKLNNTLGQALLAKRMGKKRLIAETGAGQHGVATAIVGAALGFKVEVFMGEVDTQRQALNVFRMELMGATVHPVTIRDTDTQGRHQRSAPRLGGKRARHALPDRVGCRPAPVPHHRARFPVRDRARGAGTDHKKRGEDS